MADKIDMSLDDIIKSKKTTQRKPAPGGRVGLKKRTPGQATGPVRSAGFAGRQQARARQNPYGRPTRSGDKWQHDMFDGNTKSAKLMVGNLHYRVSDKDLMELFSEFGHIKKATIHYDKSGRSLGNGEVVFATRISAVKARDKYNDVLLDGRKMKITLVGDTQQAVIRQAPAARVSNQGKGNTVGRRNQSQQQQQQNNRPKQSGPKKQKQTPPTLEQLDADLEAYVNKN